MTDRTRKTIVFSASGLALTWAALNTGKRTPSPASPPQPPPVVSEQLLPSADKVVINIEKKEQEPWGGDPFRQSRQTTAKVKASKQLSWVCSGILYKSDAPSAFVNGRAVQVGDTVDQARVVAIDRKTVTLEHNGTRFRIEIARG